MPIFRRKFKSGSNPDPEPMRLQLVADRFSWLAPRLEDREIEPDLLRAQLADHCRDAELLPVDPQAFDRWTTDLNTECWRRLALAVSAFEDPLTRNMLATLAQVRELDDIVESGLVAFARESGLLTMAVLRQSELRSEELARKLARRLGVGILGESEEESEQELERLDYGRLLAEAERAKELAEDRMTYLRERQEEELRRRRPRGKW